MHEYTFPPRRISSFSLKNRHQLPTSNKRIVESSKEVTLILVAENRQLRRIYGSETEDVAGVWREFQ
jgi:hypothetical protein